MHALSLCRTVAISCGVRHRCGPEEKEEKEEEVEEEGLGRVETSAPWN